MFSPPTCRPMLYFGALGCGPVQWREDASDMIKRNESDIGDIVFEILAKTVFKFFCFILFLALSNPS